MMQGVLNAVRLQAMMEGQSRVSMRLATVSSYDPDHYSAKVLIQPEGIETGWLPVASPWAGNGWGMFMPPSQGDVVKVHFQEEDINAGIIGLRLFTDSEQALSVPSGEFWLVHKSGSMLKFFNDGKVELTSAGTLSVKAPSILLKNAGSALKKLLNSAFATWAAGHSHPANGSPPSTLPDASMQTSIVQAE